MSRVPSFTFCIISVSSPSWLDPNTVIATLPLVFSFTRLANSSAERAKSEPGDPTWPSLSSVWAVAGKAAQKRRAAARSFFMCRAPGVARMVHVRQIRQKSPEAALPCGSARRRREMVEGGADAAGREGNLGELQPHLHSRQSP